MPTISALGNADGDLFLTTDISKYSKLVGDNDWSPAAALFDSYSSPDGVNVHRLVNDKLGAIAYAYESSEIRGKTSQGWIDEGVAFKASAFAKKGLTPIRELYRSSDQSYFYAYDDELIGEMISDGYQDLGTAWYSPINDGMIEINSYSYDPITGRLKVKYSLDELHLGQFRSYKNVLTYRLVAEDGQGNIESVDVGSAKLSLGKANKSTGVTKGVANVSLDDSLSMNIEDIRTVSLTINSKYGASKFSEQPLYGFVRTTALQLEGPDLSISRITDSGDIGDIDYANLLTLPSPQEPLLSSTSLGPSTTDSGREWPPGYYRQPVVENRVLPGVDWSNVVFAQGRIINNNLTAGNLNSARMAVRTEIVDQFGNTVEYPSIFNNNVLKDAAVNDFYWKFQNSVIYPYGINQNLISGSKGEMKIESNSSYMVSRMVIRNDSGQPANVVMASPQFYLNQDIMPGETVRLAGAAYADWKGNYWGEGRDDVYASITKSNQQNSGLLSIINPAGPATFYINGQEKDDDGSEGFIRWAFNGDNDDYKQWTVTIV